MSFVCEENTKPVSFHGQRCWTRDFCVCTKAYRIDCDSHMALGSGDIFFLIMSFTKSKRDLGLIRIIFILRMRKPKPAVAKQLQTPCSQNPTEASWQQVRGPGGHPLPLWPSSAVLPTWLGWHVPRRLGRSQMISFPFGTGVTIIITLPKNLQSPRL